MMAPSGMFCIAMPMLTAKAALSESPCDSLAKTTPTAIPFGGEAELVDLNQAINRRAFLEVGFYPPGVPFLYSGDLITEEKIAILQKEMQYKEVFGLDNNGIYVLK
mgnify:CR=1 FL=1